VCANLTNNLAAVWIVGFNGCTLVAAAWLARARIFLIISHDLAWYTHTHRNIIAVLAPHVNIAFIFYNEMLALTAESYISAAATNTTRAAVKQTGALQRCRLGVASRESLALASDQTHAHTVCALGNLKIQSLAGLSVAGKLNYCVGSTWFLWKWEAPVV
jgi:hypothetical protein